MGGIKSGINIAKWYDYPFKLGVASGDPLSDIVVLWTRLAPDPLNGGGMPSANVPVQWQIAEDESMRRVVSSGTVMATPELAHDLKADFSNPNSRTVGTEFVGTSISSDFPAAFIAPVTAALTDNPHTKFFDGAFRGYVRCHLTAKRWQADYRVVSTIKKPNAPVSTLASFVVEDGRPGAERV